MRGGGETHEIVFHEILPGLSCGASVRSLYHGAACVEAGGGDARAGTVDTSVEIGQAWRRKRKSPSAGRTG